MARADTRRIILDAALDCFLSKGYGSTSIADIKARAKVTTGSVYHFFEGKDDIAQALCAEAIRSRALAAADLPRDMSPKDTVRAMIAGTITWAFENEARHRYLIQSQFLAPGLSLRPDLIDVLMEVRLSRERVWRGLLASGAVRPLSADILSALILGPAETFLQDHAHGRTTSTPEEAIDALAEAAWRAIAVEADPAADTPSSRRTARTPPTWDLV